MTAYYDGFDYIAKRHFDAAGFGKKEQALFWFGVLLRAIDNDYPINKTPALDKLFDNEKFKKNFNVLMLFQRFEKQAPEALKEKFLSTYSSEVEEMETPMKVYYISGGYSFYGVFIRGDGVGYLEWMTASEAEERWYLQKGTVRAACIRGPLEPYNEKRLVRKSGGTWLVTDIAMEEVYGKPK